jgi:photosystem II stability/assembly factor-like uncharacterized protein
VASFKNRLPLLSVLILLLGCPGAQDHGEWTAQELPTDADFKGVFFLDSMRGWVVGGGYPVEGGIVGNTVDGGRTWAFKSDVIHKVRQPHNVHLHAVWFLDERRGFIASGTGQILRTVDGGDHWHAVHRDRRFLLDLYFVDDLHGWVVGDSTILRTTDGGESWHRPIPYESDPSFSAGAVRFVDRNVGWTVGRAGAIHHTIDGGESWTQQAQPESGKPRLWALSAIDADRAWAVGEIGTVMHTKDGGRNWSRQKTGTGSTLMGVHFLDASRGWAVGFDRSDSSSIVLHTIDGGENWVPQLQVEGTALYALGFTETGYGWAVGQRIRPHPPRLLRYEPAAAE